MPRFNTYTPLAASILKSHEMVDAIARNDGVAMVRAVLTVAEHINTAAGPSDKPLPRYSVFLGDPVVQRAVLDRDATAMTMYILVTLDIAEAAAPVPDRDTLTVLRDTEAAIAWALPAGIEKYGPGSPQVETAVSRLDDMVRSRTAIELQKQRTEQMSDYAIALQRIIEALARGEAPSAQVTAAAPHLAGIAREIVIRGSVTPPGSAPAPARVVAKTIAPAVAAAVIAAPLSDAAPVPSGPVLRAD